jgi:hypothetical protein
MGPCISCSCPQLFRATSVSNFIFDSGAPARTGFAGSGRSPSFVTTLQKPPPCFAPGHRRRNVSWSKPSRCLGGSRSAIKRDIRQRVSLSGQRSAIPDGRKVVSGHMAFRREPTITGLMRSTKFPRRAPDKGAYIDILVLTVFSAAANCRSWPRLLSCQSNSLTTSGSIGLPSRAVPFHV